MPCTFMPMSWSRSGSKPSLRISSTYCGVMPCTFIPMSESTSTFRFIEYATNVFRSDALDLHADQFVGGGLHAFGADCMDVFRRDALNFHGDQIVCGKILEAFGLHAVYIGLRFGGRCCVLSFALRAGLGAR